MSTPDADTTESWVTTTERAYAGKSPDVRRAERAARLIDSAIEVFGTEGYQAATVDRLCRHASVSPKHLYEQFSGRDDLLIAAYDRVIGDIYDTLAEALTQAPADLSQRVDVGVRALVSAYLDDPRRARIACVVAVGVDPDLDRRRREMLNRFAALLTDEADRAGLVTDREYSGIVNLALVGGANEVFVNWLEADPRTRPSRDRLVEAISELIRAAATITPR